MLPVAATLPLVPANEPPRTGEPSAILFYLGAAVLWKGNRGPGEMVEYMDLPRSSARQGRFPTL